MTIQELMEKRAKVWEAAKNFVDTHENENGVLSAEDSATYERMEAEIEDLTKAIDRHRKAEEMEKNLNQPVNQPLTGKPYAGGQGEPKIGRASDEYRRAMLNALRSNFRQVSNTLQEGVDADGGYLVPEEYDRRLVDVLNEENIMAPSCHKDCNFRGAQDQYCSYQAGGKLDRGRRGADFRGCDF